MTNKTGEANIHLTDLQGVTDQVGWVIGRSIALELDTAIGFACGKMTLGELPEEFTSLVRALPAEWREEYIDLLGEPKPFGIILEPTAILADVLHEEDYSRATLAMREMSLEKALERLKDQSAAYGLQPDSNLPLPERLVDLTMRFRLALYSQLGFHFDAQTPHISQEWRQMGRVIHILQGGNLHDRFWHWLDRFYYNIYQPWVAQRQNIIDEQKRRAITVLGVVEKKGVIPDLTWLPEKNPLQRTPELREAVENGRMSVFYWVEPFGLVDSWILHPGFIGVSFSETDKIYKNFYDHAENVARRAQALADPTRLVILRLIRNIGMTNTDMAAYLGLARPTVSIHARILREAGLIRSRQEGRLVKHEIVPEELRRLFTDLERFLDLPDEDTK
jgi:DNA-binding transcriptional ArsR family regulator